MANQFKGIWLVITLIAAGVVIFSLTILGEKPKPQGVELKEIFKQEAPAVVSDAQPVQVPEVQKDPVASPAIVSDNDMGKETGFAVQVYSFQDKNRADIALEALKNNGYANAYMIISNLGEKGTWYRVRIGNLSDDATAQAMLEKIRLNYNSGFIVKPSAIPEKR